MRLKKEKIEELRGQYGDAFYLLDTGQFEKNFGELKQAFSSVYPKFNIAYSYKTNYIPVFCKAVDRLGGYAEVVSDMELALALKNGAGPEKIIWNGPYKKEEKVRDFLLSKGTVNLDSKYETEMIKKIAGEYPQHLLRIGIRCNFDIHDGVVSRFGFDTESEEFREALSLEKDYGNIHLSSLQCHFATRRADTWKARAEGMLDIVSRYHIRPDYIDLGGGIFGKMPDSLKRQFDCPVPDYREYAGQAASVFAQYYKNTPDEKKPVLLIEPGSALAGDCMSFAAKVVSIKRIRGKATATVAGSIYNINPTLNRKNPPIEVFHTGGNARMYDDLDFGGFTCIESDYLYRHYSGELAEGDMAVFHNAGSYSIVLKPPFILPNFPVVDISGGKSRTVKRQESFDDIFRTFDF